MLLVSGLVLAPLLAFAQGPRLGGGSGGGDERPIDENEALASATASFRAAAKERLEELLADQEEPPKADRAALQRRVDAAVEEFEREARAELTRLRGDGALTFDEVTNELEGERSENLNELDNLLRADMAGVSPPPSFRSDRSASENLGELAHYTVWVRNAPSRWLIFVACIVLGVLAAGLVSWLLGALSRRRFPRTAGALAAVEGPLYGAASLAGVAVGLRWIWLPAGVRDAAEGLVGLGFAIASLWLVWILCGVVAQAVGWVARKTRASLDDHQIDLVRKALRLGALSIFALVAADLVFDTDIRTVLAGLGILTLGVSLAAQDTLKNLMGSLTVYGDKPFVQGDLVRYRNVLGTVEDIGFRSTRLRRLTGELVTIPNADVVREPIENLSMRPWWRTRFRIDLTYDTPTDRVEEALQQVRELLSEREHQPEDRPCEVLLEELGSHSLRVLVEFAHESGDYWEGLREAGEVKLAIHRIFTEQGFEFAFPTETVDLRTERPGRLDDDGSEASADESG